MEVLLKYEALQEQCTTEGYEEPKRKHILSDLQSLVHSQHNLISKMHILKQFEPLNRSKNLAI